MSVHKKPSLPPAPRPGIKEAETASSSCLKTVQQIFGHLDDDSTSFDDEPTIVRRLKNGGRARLARRLRLAGFRHTPAVGADSA